MLRANLTLQRSGYTVRLYKPLPLRPNFAVRDGITTLRTFFDIPSGDNLANAVSAKLLIKTWNAFCAFCFR
jgi:hypothetical protein